LLYNKGSTALVDPFLTGEVMKDEIKLIRLTSGEELIGRFSSVDDKVIIGRNLTVLIPTQSNSLGLAPYMPYTTVDMTGIELRLKDIMFILDPIEELKNRYKEIHGDLLVPAQKRIIV
jgi:hypothetical protein